MWFLVILGLIIPFRITIKSENSHKFLISSSIDKIENIKENLITNEIGNIFIYIWITVMCMFFIYYVITSIIFKIKIGKKEIKDKKILEILEFTKKEMGVKTKVKLLEQNYKKIPCIYGIFRPKILVTKEILKKDDENLKFIFMHELAHLKKHDLILNKILILITTIHWFNPIIWYCFKQIRQDMELKADEMVLNKIKKEEEKTYAKTLVKLLPISEEEKQPIKLLCVTDEKKNMERRIKMIKLSDKFKEYKTLIGITTLLIVLCIGTFIFTKIKTQENQVEIQTNRVQYFETPNRIVYKEKGKDNYYVLKQGEPIYTEILNEIISGFDSKEEGIMLSNEEIKQIEQTENYIELDYDTISKNYIIAYEKGENNIIFKNDNGGQVVKQKLSNKENIKKLVEEKIKNNATNNCYHMEDNEEYALTTEISDETLIKNVSGLKLYESGIYGIKIENKETLNEILQRYNIKLKEDINDEIFERTDIIFMASKYRIEKIETRIGGLTYYFEGEKNNNNYYISIYAASKAINTNCIYRNLDKTINNNISNNNLEINNNKTNNNTYDNNVINNNIDTNKESNSEVNKTIKITKEQAAQIAEEEAKNEKYQYQPWKSEFSATEAWVDENGNYEIAAELIYTLDDIHRLYYWESEWAKDSNINNIFKGQPVWCVRLGDKEDPLTNLYIYVDATNENVVGAGKASD